MSELPARLSLHLDDYQLYVIKSRHKHLGADWKPNLAGFLRDEMVEVIAQHGGAEAVLALMPHPPETEYKPEFIAAETRYKMADEVGDNLWFTVDTLDRVGSSVESACREAFKSHGITVDRPLRDFNDIQHLTIDHADQIRHLSKAGIMLGHQDLATTPDHLTTSLEQNPLNILTRTGRRLTRALEEGERDVTPYASAADFEPVADIELAAGQYLLTLAYILKTRLGVSMNGVALFNQHKLNHRLLHGKSNDLVFDDFYTNL